MHRNQDIFFIMINSSTTIAPLTVTQLNNQVKTSLENQYQNLNVIGEINELNKHSSGHVYFKLKDEMSSVPCVMFNSTYKKNNINFEEGDKVLLIGNATLYLTISGRSFSRYISI